MSTNLSDPNLRQPIVVVLGHVDSGKTSLLDKVRGTAVQTREVGGITQHIGASFFPAETLQKICGPLLDKLGGTVKIPGLLVIDTPGHEVFSNLRSRGGSAADISIVVVDVMKGFEMQTYESLGILKKRKVPFLIALNKLDTIPGWTKISGGFTSSLKKRDRSVVDELDNRIYTVVGALSREGMISEAFFRVKNPAREVSIVPVSAKTGEGIPELLSVLIGLTQQYLSKKLSGSREETRGIVLEVKKEPGLGDTANVILIEGILRTHDQVVLAKRNGPVVTKVKALFMPKPLDEMRDPRDKFKLVDEVVAAAGVKISTPDLEGVLGGSPILGAGDGGTITEVEKRQVESEVQAVFIETDKLGVVIKADTLGSLEAIVEMLKKTDTQIRSADIGPISRRDVVNASLVGDKDRYFGVILAFGVKVLEDAKEEAVSKGVRIFSEGILYDLITSYTAWVQEEKEAIKKAELGEITLPSKFRVLKGMVFRRSDPAVFGIEVIEGTLKQKSDVMNSRGKTVGMIKQIQDKGESITSATKGTEVAVSISGVVVGRTVIEGETLFTLPSQAGMRLLQDKYKVSMSEEEQSLLEDILSMKRKVAPLYGF